MLRKVAMVGAVALLGAAVAAAGVGHGSAKASLSNASAGARPVALTIGLPAELRCGRLSARSLTVILPRAMHIPRSIARAGVRLDGRAVGSVEPSGSTILVRLVWPKGITCFSIVEGVAHLQFARSAGLGNPARAGSYAFTVEAKPRSQVWHGSLVVHS
jgi:hypothetical protein